MHCGSPLSSLGFFPTAQYLSDQTQSVKMSVESQEWDSTTEHLTNWTLKISACSVRSSSTARCHIHAKNWAWQWGLCHIFATFWNQESNKHTHFLQWLARCVTFSLSLNARNEWEKRLSERMINFPLTSKYTANCNQICTKHDIMQISACFHPLQLLL